MPIRSSVGSWIRENEIQSGHEPVRLSSIGQGVNGYHEATEYALVDNWHDVYGATSVPIYQSATFKQTSATEFGAYDYSRSGNPTRSHLETHMAKLLGAERAFALNSGMSALDAITRLVRAGEEIIAGDDLYGGTNRLLTFLKEMMGVIVHHVDTRVVENVEEKLNDKTRIVLLETPTNPLLKVADIPGISRVVHDRSPHILVVVDNTMMSPYLQKTLTLGADIEYHSATKYLSGHHDLMAGVIGCKSEAIAQKIYFVINSVGSGLGPFESFLLLRGVKTLPIRMEKQQQSTDIVAKFLVENGLKVHYVGLPEHPQYELHQSMSRGAGAVLSFETGSIEKSEQIVSGCKIFTISVSFGCVNSLISMPCRMSHASIPAHIRAERQLPEDVIRLSIGIEDVEDLIDDLTNAFLKAGLDVKNF
ncbi:hypothetical protein PROFUN_07001 [Planoprotostelium fungivorum]|uniref:cysteine-S-conjugate beta-lyase n=1 Tax=Planoprotostelium fungivorum TaxID=1890364 RepID=A0A2P6NMQ3_9EUKA|nr:hypothetical protein PROFUN_07001 [Planoprotostelium fungivorum]